LELILQTIAGSERLVPLILPEGNNLVIDILDATLVFAIRNGVEKLNPAEGINKITVNKVDDRSIRVRVSGETQAPSAEVIPGSNLVLSINPQGATARQAPDGDRYSNQTISVAQVNDEYGTEAYTVNSFPGSILSDLGLQRPQSQAISKPGGTIEAISEERLELIDGDLLFMLTFSDRDRQMLENLLQKPLWRKLKAVQNGQVYSLDGWTWVVANPLAADAVIEDLYKYLVNTP
jgi:Periplasmic binding protein/AMIN domain